MPGLSSFYNVLSKFAFILPANNLLFTFPEPIFHISIGLYSFNVLILRPFELDILDSRFSRMIICAIEYYASLYFAFSFFDSIFYDSISCSLMIFVSPIFRTHTHVLFCHALPCALISNYWSAHDRSGSGAPHLCCWALPPSNLTHKVPPMVFHNVFYSPCSQEVFPVPRDTDCLSACKPIFLPNKTLPQYFRPR